MKKIKYNLKRFIIFIWIKLCQIFSVNSKKESEEIKKIKNSKQGKRVFIVATGPSLTIKDLDLIKKENSISMNSIISAFDKTEFRPTYYLIQDGTVVEKLKDLINQSDLSVIFAGIGNSFLMKANADKQQFNKIHKKKIWYNLNSNYHYYDMCYKPEKAKMKFSNDFSKQVYDGFTVTYSAIQLAYYLGFKEVYLLGCDCTFGGHFDDRELSEDSRVVKPAYFKAYECAKKMIQPGKFEIYNCTRGGMLDVFERKSLEDVVYEKI